VPAKAREPLLANDEELIKRMIQTYREHSPTISLHSDADATLTRLRATHKLGLITDGPAQSQSAKIDALQLRARFDAMVLTDELGEGFAKPHPRAFELVSEQLGATGPECVYIADNPAKDFVAPNALGWATIQIVRPDGIYRETPPAKSGTPNHVIDTMTQMDGLIQLGP
jgi:putative hydrolase of the HAD superfamily